jgi:hypothetical protein
MDEARSDSSESTDAFRPSRPPPLAARRRKRVHGLPGVTEGALLNVECEAPGLQADRYKWSVDWSVGKSPCGSQALKIVPSYAVALLQHAALVFPRSLTLP